MLEHQGPGEVPIRDLHRRRATDQVPRPSLELHHGVYGPHARCGSPRYELAFGRQAGRARHLPARPADPLSTACGHDAEAAPAGPATPDGTDLIPDTEPTEGAEVLAQLKARVARFVILPSEEALVATTLWVAATHLQKSWQHAPRLAVVGPAKRCGKSRLLDVLTETVHQALLTVNSSPAAVFRSITDEPPTLLVDEADTIFGSPKMAEKNEEMRGLLNAGHQRDRYVLRVVGNDHTPRKFPTFAMAAIAGIGDLPDTIMDRSIVIRMRRRAEGESVSPYRSERDRPGFHEIRDRIARWTAPLAGRALHLEPDMPVEDRAADTWEPLVIIADLAGGPGPASPARRASAWSTPRSRPRRKTPAARGSSPTSAGSSTPTARRTA